MLKELKSQLREPLGLGADASLALSYQNGWGELIEESLESCVRSRNSLKKVLEEKQGLREQGVEEIS